jgi:hypothetical protein
VDKQLQEYDANVGFRCGGITVNIDDMVRSIDFDCVAHDRPRVFLALQSTFMFASFMTFPGQCNSRFAAAHESASLIAQSGHRGRARQCPLLG